MCVFYLINALIYRFRLPTKKLFSWGGKPPRSWQSHDVINVISQWRPEQQLHSEAYCTRTTAPQGLNERKRRKSLHRSESNCWHGINLPPWPRHTHAWMTGRSKWWYSDNCGKNDVCLPVPAASIPDREPLMPGLLSLTCSTHFLVSVPQIRDH